MRTRIYKLSPEEDVSYDSDRSAVSRRFREIQQLWGEEADNEAFADRLNAAASELGFSENWTANRVSKLRGATQGISTEDAYVIARVDPKLRGMTYVTHGIAVSKGEDAAAALARAAKRQARNG